jgi:hypothetical protein
MSRLNGISWLIGLLVLPQLGCLEEFNKLHESQMPRIGENLQGASGPRAIGRKQDNWPAESFNARALWDEYGGNVVQADLDCKGKTLRVTGIIRTVAKDDRGRAFVGFQVFETVTVPAGRLKMMSAKERTWYQEGFPPLVICYLDSTDRSDLPTVKKGQTIQLTGRCLGRIKDPSGFKDYVVVMDSCRINEDDHLVSAGVN